MFLFVLGQILLGGWVSSNYAAVACADFPTCQGQWWPDANFAKGFNLYQSIGPNYLGGILHSEARAAIHFTHRLGALAVTIIGVFFYFNLFKSCETKSLAKIGFALLTVQMGLGISNVLFQFPMTIALLHTLFAGILLLHSLHCVIRFTLPISVNLKHLLDKGQIA
jgi:cytochrome c oxidase assembly protein subunit 15